MRRKIIVLLKQRWLISSIVALAVSLIASDTNAGGSCCDVPGDADNSGTITLADPILIAQYLFADAAVPACPKKWDADGSGEIDIRDIVRLIKYSVLAGTAPVCPGGITYDDRVFVFDAMDSIDAALGNVPLDSLADVLFNFLNGRSEFSYVDREDNTLWATFTDGRMLFIPNNRIPEASEPTENSDSYHAPDSIIPDGLVVPKRLHHSDDKQANVVIQTSSQAPTYELPESVDATIINTLGLPCFTSATNKVKTMLTNNGYAIIENDGTLTDLLTTVHDIGVFYIDAHGGWGRKTSTSPLVAAFWTNTLASRSGDQAYEDLLNNNEIVYMWARDMNGHGGCVNQRRYAVTGEFVKNYMTFAKNSFVLVNTCYLAATARGATISDGFKTAGASVYAGWTNSVSAAASDKAGEYLIDRMLGANASTLTPVENPKQRPFDYTELKTDMHTRGYDRDATYNANLVITELKDGFQLLAPSLRFVQVINTTDTLFLTGFFGTDPGPAQRRVLVNGVAMVVFDWQPLYIWADIPRTGPGSAGPVVVERTGDTQGSPSVARKSNPVNLTEWKGEFTYTHANSGTLKGKIVINAHIRADVHAFRETPHTPAPAPNSFIVFSGVKDSYGMATAEGQYIYVVPGSDPAELQTWTWTGANYLPWLDTPGPDGVLIQGQINGTAKSMDVMVFGSSASGLKEALFSSTNGLLHNIDLSFVPPFDLYDVIPYKLNLNFDDDWSIYPGVRAKSACCTVSPTGGSVIHQMIWSTIPPSFAPDSTAAQ